MKLGDQERLSAPRGVEVIAPIPAGFSEILTYQALGFVASLHRRFSAEREELLLKREERQRELDKGMLPGFLPETEGIRSGVWTIAPEPPDLQKRHVEITGPAGDAKMVINALNSGADTYMADFEDSQSPTWLATIQGQMNLRDAVEGTIRFTSQEGRAYKLNEKTATLLVRPRGWHLLEKHVFVDGEPVSASLFDFGLFLFHNGRKLVAKGTGPYFYLPKLEGHREARLWNDVFDDSEDALGLTRGTVKATVLIETILAAFEMDEILYELRQHSAGLNCGRWDYIFSFIKKFRARRDFDLPDRAQITMDKAFLRAYVELSVKTCHRRRAHSIGGMSAYIPSKDGRANEVAMARVREDKEREVKAGHDGTWVAHPALVPLAQEIFSGIGGPHQIGNLRDDVEVNESQLLEVPDGEITAEGVRRNISVGVQYLEAWLRGRGSVPLYNLMEDAATSEICRAQIWQWVKHGTKLGDGRGLTPQLLRTFMDEETDKIRRSMTEDAYGRSKLPLAARLFEQMSVAEEFPDFLTIPAYDRLLALEAGEWGVQKRASD